MFGTPTGCLESGQLRPFVVLYADKRSRDLFHSQGLHRRLDNFHGSRFQSLRKDMPSPVVAAIHRTLNLARRLAMNRPTPNPSQEGSKHSSASRRFPSWEGLGSTQKQNPTFG